MLKSNRSSFAEKFHDIPALRDFIRKLKIRREDLNYETESLQKEISELDEKSTTLRGELNVLSAVDHVRIHTNDGFIKESDDKLQSDEDKKFAEANMKLEIKILNAEIRHSLPSLEAEALKWEEAVFSAQVAENAAQKEYESLPPELTMTVAEMESEVEKQQRERDKIKTSYSTDTANCLNDIRLNLAQVRAHSADVRQQLQERELGSAKERHSREAYEAEKARVDWLLDQLLRLKVEAGGEGDKGWASALFLDAAGSSDGSIPRDKIPSLLSPWLTQADDLGTEQCPKFVPEADVSKAVDDSLRKGDLSVGRTEFLNLCSALSKSQRK